MAAPTTGLPEAVGGSRNWYGDLFQAATLYADRDHALEDEARSIASQVSPTTSVRPGSIGTREIRGEHVAQWRSRTRERIQQFIEQRC